MLLALHQKQQFGRWIFLGQHVAALHSPTQITPCKLLKLSSSQQLPGKDWREPQQNITGTRAGITIYATLHACVGTQGWGQIHMLLIHIWHSCCSWRVSVAFQTGALQDNISWHFSPTLMEEKFLSTWISKHCLLLTLFHLLQVGTVVTLVLAQHC